MHMLSVRMGQAVRQVEADLLAAARCYPAKLPKTHLARLTGHGSGVRQPVCLRVGSPFEQLRQLSPLARTLEVNRSHAEALLALAKAGELAPGEEELARLTERALGMLPTEEGERLVEAASCAELEPQFMTSTPGRFAAGMTEVEKNMGQATALAYGFLLLAGVRSRADLMKYGMRLEQVFSAVTGKPAVRAILGTTDATGIRCLKRESRVRLLAAVRDALWQEKPDRPGTAFLLTQVVDGYVRRRPGPAGDSLGLAVLDAIVVAKLGLAVRFMHRQGHIYLEIVYSPQAVQHWDPLDRGAAVPVASTHRLTMVELAAQGYLRMARGYALRKNYAHGERVADWVIEMEPGNADAHTIRAECLLGSGNPNEALTASERALEIDHRLADAYVVQGNACGALGRWPEAVECYRKAIRCRVGYAEAYNNLGLALVRNGEPERALGAFNEAVRVRPDYAEAYYNIGNLHMEQNRPDEAIEAYKKAVVLVPDFAAAHYNLGQAYYARKDLPRALAAYEAAVSANPKHAGAWHNMGIVYRDMGEQERAVEAIEKAVQLNPLLLR
ncbi:MAG: tetratricopeptide repeat protein [candidate division WOR-3 bacterium]